MKKLLAIPALALVLIVAACVGNVPGDGSPERSPAERQRALETWSLFVSMTVGDFVAIYGPDWFEEIDRGERFALLTGCNGLFALSASGRDVPPEVTGQVAEVCSAIRRGTAPVPPET